MYTNFSKTHKELSESHEKMKKKEKKREILYLDMEESERVVEGPKA